MTINPYAYTEEEIPPYKESLGKSMVLGAAAALILCLAFVILSIGFAVFVQVWVLLGY